MQAELKDFRVQGAVFLKDLRQGLSKEGRKIAIHLEKAAGESVCAQRREFAQIPRAALHAQGRALDTLPRSAI